MLNLSHALYPLSYSFPKIGLNHGETKQARLEDSGGPGQIDNIGPPIYISLSDKKYLSVWSMPI